MRSSQSFSVLLECLHVVLEADYFQNKEEIILTANWWQDALIDTLTRLVHTCQWEDMGISSLKK